MADAYAVADPVIAEYQVLVDDLDRRISAYFSSRAGIDAERRWSECMAQAGYSFPRREDAITHFLATSGASEGNMLVTEEEIQVRLADIECDRAMKFTEDRSRWERAVFEEWLERTGAQWTELDGRVSSVVAQLERMDG